MVRTSSRTPIELRIEDLAFGGEGVGRYEGKVHFVAGSYPGERVLAVPIRSAKRWKRARLIEVLEESPDRVAPKCSHTGICGGCVYQTLSYPCQLAAKANQVRENLARIAGIRIPEPEPPLAAPSVFHYRNKMEFSFAPRAWDPVGPPETPAPGPALGLHVPGRYDAVFDVHDCALCDTEVNDLLALVRDTARARSIPAYHDKTGEGILRHLVIRSSVATGEWLISLVVKDERPDIVELARRCLAAHPRIAGFLLWIHEGVATVARADREVLLSGKDRIIEKVGGLGFELSASSFFQTNTAAAEELVRELRALVPKTGFLMDLYCGVGTLGLALADHCEELLGIESSEAAVADARRNAARNGILHARFEVAQAEEWLREVPRRTPELLIVDPPRAGLHPKALQGVVSLAAPEIIYVSCNPATLARDLATLIADDRYQPERMRVVDLFPHTPHVETIVKLRRTGS
jgi:23S rRNA (uracil1939-C5)-methyltransferase